MCGRLKGNNKLVLTCSKNKDIQKNKVRFYVFILRNKRFLLHYLKGLHFPIFEFCLFCFKNATLLQFHILKFFSPSFQTVISKYLFNYSLFLSVSFYFQVTEFDSFGFPYMLMYHNICLEFVMYWNNLWKMHFFVKFSFVYMNISVFFPLNMRCWAPGSFSQM